MASDSAATGRNIEKIKKKKFLRNGGIIRRELHDFIWNRNQKKYLDDAFLGFIHKGHPGKPNKILQKSLMDNA